MSAMIVLREAVLLLHDFTTLMMMITSIVFVYCL